MRSFSAVPVYQVGESLVELQRTDRRGGRGFAAFVTVLSISQVLASQGTFSV